MTGQQKTLQDQLKVSSERIKQVRSLLVRHARVERLRLADCQSSTVEWRVEESRPVTVHPIADIHRVSIIGCRNRRRTARVGVQNALFGWWMIETKVAGLAPTTSTSAESCAARRMRFDAWEERAARLLGVLAALVGLCPQLPNRHQKMAEMLMVPLTGLEPVTPSLRIRGPTSSVAAAYTAFSVG